MTFRYWHSTQMHVIWVHICIFFFFYSVPFLFSGDKTLDGYQKKKYVCKLLFIFLLGHDIDFGHMEAVNLLSSNKYTEKQIVSISLFNTLWSSHTYDAMFICLLEILLYCFRTRVNHLTLPTTSLLVFYLFLVNY